MKLISVGEIIWDVFGEERTLGGAPLNFAAHAALQGADAYILSAVGDDSLGQRSIKEVSLLGVGTEYISVVPDYPTGQCVVTLDKSGVPTYEITDDVAYDRIGAPTELCKDFDVVAFGTLALRHGENRLMLEQLLSSDSFSEVFTDLNIRAPFYSSESVDFCLSKATIVKISDEELPIVNGLVFGEDFDTEESVNRLSRKYRQIKLILVTKGEKGSLCYDTRSGRIYERAAGAARVVSTVGAGDSFGATFLTQYIKTGDIENSMKLASAVSAFVVSHAGAIPGNIKEFLVEQSIV